jgi:hypothetical protein
MEKFAILPCTKQDKVEHDYNGYVIGLVNVQNPHFIIFFPVVEEGAHMINFLLEPKENKDSPVDIKTLSVFKTMIDTWKASNIFLSGVVMDVEQEKDDGMILVSLYLSDTNTGKIDSIVSVNFLHAVIISVMEQTPIIISDNLLHNIMPDDEEESCPNCQKPEKKEKKKKYPKDKNIIDIARKIMSGKIK